jgi:type VI secretion system protein ImpC
MPRTSSRTSVEIDVEEKPGRAAVLDPDEPFRILVMGNFSGGAGRNRRLIEIDRDNFDQVLALLAPELHLVSGGAAIPVRFRSLDEFHPDQLFARLPLFQKLRELRQRLADPATFSAAAAELEPRATPPAPRVPNLSGADLLRQITGEEAPRDLPEEQSGWDRMIGDIVTRYGAAGPDPRQPQWIARIDDAITGEMRTLLHHPDFQAIESAWRGMYFLTRRLDTGEELKIYLMDLPQEELTSGAGLADIARALDAQPMAAMAGLYAFGKSDEPALGRLAALAQNANVPFLAGLAPSVVGMEELFGDLRQSLKARWIGLAMPRFLLRLPYGATTDETETFGFEEMPTPPQHERYLWGNPAIACAYLLGEAFSRYGWRMRPGIVQEIESLPAHIYKAEGASELKPCAEILLTESAAELLMDRGFMPLASIKGSDRIRLVRFQSLAKPPAPLAGKWE